MGISKGLSKIMYEIFEGVMGGAQPIILIYNTFIQIYYDFMQILHWINKNTMILHEGLLGIPRD